MNRRFVRYTVEPPTPMLKKILTPAAKREAAAHLVASYEMSERRACRTIQADRKMVRHPLRRAPDKALRASLRELAGERASSVALATGSCMFYFALKASISTVRRPRGSIAKKA